MTKEELNYIKDAFSQIIDDIAGNPDWYEAARAVASDLGTLERKLEEKVSSLPSNLDEAAEEYEHNLGYYECMNQWPSVAFKAGAEWAAGQGDTIDGQVVNFFDGIAVSMGRLVVNDGRFKVGDKVIVQIRKKEE